MRGSKVDVPVAMEAMGVVVRQLEWGNMNFAFESFPAGTDTEPIFKGLPDDRCQCPHWGYVIKGRMQIRYKDHDEIVSAGDAYYLQPGHLPLFLEDSEIVEFSPLGEYQETLEVVGQNIAAAMEHAHA
jgi:hypothetical protein